MSFIASFATVWTTGGMILQTSIQIEHAHCFIEGFSTIPKVQGRAPQFGRVKRVITKQKKHLF
jgi:hypothetical protein